MSRIRSIKPDFFTNEQLAECSPTARLLFIGMWCFCDDNGVHPASVVKLKLEVLPGDTLGLSDVGNLVQQLIEQDLIREYTVGGKAYWIVTGWKHQKIEKPSFKHPLPCSTENLANWLATPPSHGGDMSASGQRPPACGVEGSREEKDVKGGVPPPAKYPPEFESAWSQYPKRSGDNPKTEAHRCWSARLKEGHTPEEIAAGIARYAGYCRQAGKTGTELVMQAKRFFGRDKAFLNDWSYTPGTNGHAKPDTGTAWLQFRASIRDQRAPQDARVAACVSKLGGLHRLGERSSFDLDRMRADFDRAFLEQHS